MRRKKGMAWLDGTNNDKLIVQVARRARALKKSDPNATRTFPEGIEEVLNSLEDPPNDEQSDV
jgi:hypothetical protein